MPPATPARRRSTACSRHPELEVVALGSDSLAGAARLGARRAPERLACPRSSRTTRRSPRGADLIFALPRPRARRPRSSRPPDAVVVDLSGAHRLADAALYREWYGFEHPRPRARDWSYALPELCAAGRAADREPGLLRDRGAARARAARRRDRPGERRRRRQVRRVGRGPRAEGELARGLRARERLAVPRRRAPARAGDRAGARLPGLLRPAPAARCGAGCSPPVTSRPTAPTCAALLEDAYATSAGRARAAGGRRARARARPAHRRAEIALFEDAPPARRSSSARSTTSARAPPARRSRTRTSRSGLDETARPAARAECSYERHCRRKGFVASGVALRDPQGGPARPRARALARARDRRGDVHGRTACWRRRWSSRRSTSSSPSRRRSSSTRASRTPRPASAACSTRSRPPPRRRGCSTSTPRRCSSSRPA